MKLTVNGETHEIEPTEDMPLLWALRDLVGVKGPKFGCGVMACGSCSVMVDGVLQRSCGVLAVDVEGAEITTIEGLGQAGSLSDVQQAWVEAGVPQCGYCQAGQIMAATALLDENPTPSDSDIDAAMTNLCRCGTYPQVREAIRLAVEMRNVQRAEN